ncbi:enoyl-CoA hydratase/isomerase family protein [Camelimonas abortus]|uniref:Enoyl-CoA hydratase/isomerase family protein n=1 Tax=Camelimonas abortus TaxID=1017184 RepID=A0ABV7LD61_9HYPH
MDDAVLLERKGHVAIVRLNREESRNALQPAVKAGLQTHIPAVMADPAVRAVVITGTGKAFCAGGDIRDMQERGGPAIRARLQRSHSWTQKLLAGEKPVIAAVNGAAAGAGLSLAMMCDIIIASDKAFFRAGFPGIGAVPDLGLALTLPRAIGQARARDLLLTNRRVEPQEALSMGLISRIAPDGAVLDEAVKLAEELAEGPAVSLGLTKTMLNMAYQQIDDFLAFEAMAQAIAFDSKEFAEGVAAFLEKRKPRFPEV